MRGALALSSNHAGANPSGKVFLQSSFPSAFIITSDEPSNRPNLGSPFGVKTRKEMYATVVRAATSAAIKAIFFRLCGDLLANSANDPPPHPPGCRHEVSL